MVASVPEKNKKPGVCYAVTDDGLELPVVDITHPAFTLSVSPEELSACIEDSVRGLEALAKIPDEDARPLVANSILLRGLVQSKGTFLSGIMTYLYRLGPENLGDGYASDLDRKIAAGLMPLTFRFRLHDMVHLLADGIEPVLETRIGCPLHLLNIAGGPSADSLNALILLNRRNPGVLGGREVHIHVLDIDKHGPGFASRALAALQADGGPLSSLEVSLHCVRYDWADTARLVGTLELLENDAVVAVSSEGGLFSYGSDDQIIGNLSVVRDYTPEDCVVVGSVSCDEATIDPRLRIVSSIGCLPAVRYLGLGGLAALAASSGWKVDSVTNSPVDHVVRMKKA